MQDNLVAAAPSVVHLHVADFAVTRGDGVLATAGLGSCVALILYERASRIGGMAHILLPHEALSRDTARPAKFATTAVPLLLHEMRDRGAGDTIEARIVGGASMFGALLTSGGINMGERNVAALRGALAASGIPIAGEDIGGDYGRSVYFDLASGAVRVVSLRHGERVL